MDNPTKPDTPSSINITRNPNVNDDASNVQDISGSQQQLLRREKSQSNISRVSSNLDQTFKNFANRIRVANRLSYIKRVEDQASTHGSTLLHDPQEAVKIIKKITPKSITNANSIRSPPQTYQDKDGQVKEGIISGGNLIFDHDYPLTTDVQEAISRYYINVTPDVELKNITDVMFDEWKLSIPRIALFLLSDADHFRTWSNARQIASFKMGVIKAAKTTSMWLVTNGLDIGVGKLIGDALLEEQNEMQTFRTNVEKKKQLPVIGITNDFNLSYTHDFFGPNIQLGKPGPISNQRRYELNPMHTNFIILQTQNSHLHPNHDSYHSLMINLIDHLTKRTSLSPEQDQDLEQPPTFIPSSTDYYYRRQSSDPNIIRRRKFVTNDDYSKLPQTQPSLDIIVRPSYGQKTNCFHAETEDMVDASPDKEETSFISPEGTVISEEPPPMSPLLDTRPTTSVKDISEKMIPVVCLVIQGDYHCAKLVLDNIRRRNPIIVLRGSGGFADLLSYAYIEMQRRCRDLYHAWDAEFVEQTLKPLLMQKIVKHFPEFRNNALARNTFRDRIIECVRESGSTNGRVFLSILNMEASSCDLTNLSEFILLSLFKSQNRRDILDSSLVRKDLYLTLDWNCPLVALDEVLSRNPSYNLQVEKSIFEIALLKRDREDFVDIFLSHGFRIHKYLTPFRLLRLIRYSLLESEFFRTTCMEAILGIAVWSVTFEELLERLSATTQSSNTTDPESFILNEFNHLLYTTNSLHDFVNVQDMYLNIMGMYPVDAGSAERKSLAILAMWAVFNRRFKLAEILWKHSDQPIHLGLILSTMLDRMAWFVSEQNLKDDLQEESKVFAQFAIQVLDSCYRNDEQRGYDLLDQKNSDWDEQTAVDIAANGSHRAFIAHPCCQKWLTNTFNGRIRVRELTWGFLTIPPVFKIILSAFLILPMYIWIGFLDFNHQWTVNKAKLLEELTQSSNDSDEEDEELLKKVSEYKLKPLDNNHKQLDNDHQRDRRKSTALDLLVDNQMTMTSIDENVRTALVRLHRKMKNQEEINKKNSSYERRNIFIDKQPPLWTMINLMWNSPITKFWTYQVFYIIYLALLSLAVIWPGCGNWYLDTAVCTWTFLNIVEDIQRLFILFRKYNSIPMFFLIIEILLLIIFLLIYTWGRVFIVSWYINGHNLSRFNIDPYTMKVILCCGLLYFYYRIFYIHLPISPTLGPLLYRFKLMVSIDFIHFMRMALILLISSGIIIQALLYPNTELSNDMFHKAFHRTIVSLFTTPVDELTKNCTAQKGSLRHQSELLNNSTHFNATSVLFQTIQLDTFKNIQINNTDLCPVKPIPMSQSCPVSGFWSYAFTFQFLICLKLILMTLLYALFASTATRLQTETDNIWKFQRYTLVIDFANRPAVHAPLSIFRYIYLFFKFLFHFLTCHFCRKKSKVGDQPDTSREGVFYIQDNNGDDNNRNRLSKEDYNYWRHLAKMIYEEEQRKEERKQSLSKQGETIQLICEEIEYEKNILRTLKTKITEFERMMYQTQIYLENLKHVNNVCQHQTGSLSQNRVRRSTTVDLNAQTQTGIHYLARLSPYSGTRIQRFPVADKFVSWDIIWINYDPVIYTRKRENFSPSLKYFVDEDLLALKEQMKAIIKRNSHSSGTIHLPVFNWNAVSVNPAGLTIDRRSWIKQDLGWDSLDCNLLSPSVAKSMSEDCNNYVIYKLDEDGIPLNLIGRTGLRGKGNQPRWGPNHYVMLLVSRTRVMNPGALTLYEFALEHRYSSLFIPIRFIGDENLFSDLRSLFKSSTTSSTTDQWNTEENLFEYFRSIDQEVQIFPPNVHYMDSPENTDNAWKEVKVYHFHFTSKINQRVTDRMIQNNQDSSNEKLSIQSSLEKDSRTTKVNQLSWINYHEDMLVQLPMEHVQFIDDAMKTLHNNTK